MDLTEFENKRWQSGDQKIVFRHRAALSLIDSGRVLDLGCGDGLLLGLLRDKGIAGEGLDISPEAVAKCKAKGLEARVHSFDQALPYADGAFEYAVLLDVLEHVYDPLHLLREAARVSRAFVIVGVPNFSSLPARLQTLRGEVPENNQPHKGHLYWFNDRVLHRVAKDAGLSFADVRMNTFFPFSRFGSGLPRIFPNLLALSFIAKLKKHG